MQSEPHGPGVGTATLTPPPFSVIDDAGSYAAAVEEFLAADAPASVPVWTGGRADLAASAERSADLYGEVSRPAARTYGIVLRPETLPAGLHSLIAPCALTWLDEEELAPALLDRLAPEDDDRPEAYSLLIAGLYEHFTVDLIWPLVRAASRRPDVRLSFLTGRDAASLAWFTAKQYVAPAPDVHELGLFTGVDRGLTRDGIHLRNEGEVATSDVKSEILGTRWRRLMLQGHGKDDSINLADFTICGLNETVGRNPALVAPICATSTCYKPVDKLIQLRDIRAAEVVLSSCNNSPFADAAVFDPKYQLMLNAIDGTARNVVGAITVHASARPENLVWTDAALAGASSAAALNASIGTSEPYPAYVQFGIGEDAGDTPEPPTVEPEQLLLTTSARLTAYLAGGVLSPNHPLRTRLGKLATKVESQVSRRDLAVHQDRAPVIRGLMDDLQSLDMAIATQFVKDPENELSNCFAYFGERSRIDMSDVSHVRCQCGRPAERYSRRALVPTSLDFEGVVCTRCGDVAFRLFDSPSLLVHAEDGAEQGTTNQVRVAVRDARPGILRLGLFFASYGRAGCTIEPDLRKVRIAPDGTGETTFTLTLAPGIPPHGYYMTAFAVQDLAVSIARRNFGILAAENSG
ncbi:MULTISPECIES: hypothetical protein [Streptomyces]|uniref:hypothetical protein n=1 Tax=Streptomyces TaxID=1883 RepID=UPI001316937E|nr:MULTISPECIES: hypothetical protein [Streptomyces]QGZ50771.1 hypothetical protein GPZ77_22480 [Streptomyces sp. QHH-9511]GGT82703.1 hypothetical protein GCM10010272_29160 [Streptomyces lateritius]